MNTNNGKSPKDFRSPQPNFESWFALLDNNFFPEGKFKNVVALYPHGQEELENWVHEDLRLFSWRDEMWFYGTTFKRSRRTRHASTKYASVVGKIHDRNWTMQMDVQFQSMRDKFKENTH